MIHSHGSTRPSGGKDDCRVLLIGNPNTGKSVLFGELTREFAEASNYPGTTLDVSWAQMEDCVLIDTPGVYGIQAQGQEEALVREAAKGADVLVNVMDATNLERGLWLALELLETGKPTIHVLNMWDEVEASGLALDLERLQERLQGPVFKTVATKGTGVPEVVRHLSAIMDTQARGASLATVDGGVLLGLPAPSPSEDPVSRRRRIDEILGEVVLRKGERAGFADRLSRIMIRPLTGVPLAFAILGGVFYFIGTFVAQDLVGFTEGVLFQQGYETFVRALVGSFLSGPLYAVLVGEFGVLTMTVTYVFGLLLPLVFFFYILMAVLEDTGYLPRLATLADRTFSALGMNGKAVIPVVLGFGCVTMATITTRMLDRRRERIIAIALLALAVPCSAQMAVILVLMAGLGLGYWALYGGILLGIFLLIGWLLSRLIRGERSDLMFELPKLRLPQWRNVLRKARFRTWIFIKDVLPLFFLGSLLISLLLVTGALTALQGWLSPLVVGWLGLPPEGATSLVMGFVRRDFGAAGFFHMDLTALQAVVGMVVITLFIPCIASVLVIHKELGLKGVLAILGFTLGTAFLIGGLLIRALTLVGVS